MQFPLQCPCFLGVQFQKNIYLTRKPHGNGKRKSTRQLGVGRLGKLLFVWLTMQWKEGTKGLCVSKHSLNREPKSYLLKFSNHMIGKERQNLWLVNVCHDHQITIPNKKKTVGKVSHVWANDGWLPIRLVNASCIVAWYYILNSVVLKFQTRFTGDHEYQVCFSDPVLIDFGLKDPHQGVEVQWSGLVSRIFSISQPMEEDSLCKFMD